MANEPACYDKHTTSWLNGVRSIKKVNRGEKVWIQVDGGWARKDAPCAGFIVQAFALDESIKETPIEVFLPRFLLNNAKKGS